MDNSRYNFHRSDDLYWIPRKCASKVVKLATVLGVDILLPSIVLSSPAASTQLSLCSSV